MFALFLAPLFLKIATGSAGVDMVASGIVEVVDVYALLEGLLGSIVQ